MGIFGNKTNKPVQITKESCVSGTAVTCLQCLQGLSEGGEIIENEIFNIWSVMHAAALRCLPSDQDKKFLNDFLKMQINNSKLLIAFEKNISAPEEVLYIALTGFSEQNTNTLAMDLAINVSNVAFGKARTISREEIFELAAPVFSHHLGEHIEEFEKEHDYLIAVLSAAFAQNVFDICQGIGTYGREGSDLRIKVAQTIFSLSLMLYILRDINR